MPKHYNTKPFLSVWTIALLSIVFYMGSLLMSSFQTGDLGNNYSTNKLQSYLLDVEHEMDYIHNELIEGIDSTFVDSAQTYFSDELINYANTEHIHVFLYKGVSNSIISWTDNDFIIESPINGNRTYYVHNSIGDFLVKDIVTGSYTSRFAYRIYRYYAVSNEYLQSGLNPNIDISKEVEISDNKQIGEPISNSNDEFLFSVVWKTNDQIPPQTYGLIYGLFVLSFMLFVAFSQQIISKYFSNKAICLISKIVVIIIIDYIWQYALLPRILIDSPLFSPTTFASAAFNSIGALNIHLLTILFIAFAIGNYLKNNIFEKLGNKKSFIFYLFSVLLFAIILHFIKIIVSDLIFNSTISYDLSRISHISYIAVIGLVALGVSISIFISLFVRANSLASKLSLRKQIIAIIVFVIIELLWLLVSGNIDFSILIFYLAVSVVNTILLNIKTKLGGATIVTIYLLMFSLLIAFWFNMLNMENERINRKAIIQSLSINQDPKTEYLFTEISKEMYKDTGLIKMFDNQNVDFDSLTEFIENKYFKSHKHFRKYDFQTTICTKDLKLMIRPQNIEINCDTFFFRNLISFGKLTDNKNLYSLDYGTGQVNYLGVFRFYSMSDDGYIVYTVYMEINSKLKRKGFTRVLRAKEYDPFFKIANYSLARYENNNRVENYGDYTYPEHLPKRFNTEKDFSFSENKNYSHLAYHLSDNVVFVLSLKKQPMLGRLAPFSYLFILFGTLFAILLFFNNLNIIEQAKIKWSFGKRLQLTMIVIILASFAIISVITMLYIKDLNKSKNRTQLTNLAVALQIEFEHKLASENDLTKVDPDYLQSLLQKFAKVFDTDINIYQLNGKLLSSTRYEVFDRKLMSELINPVALKDLKLDHQSIFIDRENIGNMLFSSAYMPFHNSEGEIIAFLNLPYFAREEVLRSEISTLLMALMNVYILIIVVAILTILFVSKYISRPLIMLKEKLQLVSVGKDNTKIEWHGIEEIEALVSEYNRMIDALALSSERLAKSERETAWREMAKQVAHEIKNPLTPMKLSVQYMMYSFDENATDNKDKLQALANTLVEQIDTLTNIATAFSDFANMPKSTKQLHDFASIINTAVDIYKDYSNVSIELSIEDDLQLFIDKNQWLRVFNNLIKNSLQAKIPDQKLIISIDVKTTDTKVIIAFRDNGHGIDEDMRDKIFVPNFTTKTKGSGLGLAMVKNIVNNSDGKISFESELGKGTIFIIELYRNNG